MSTRHRDRSRSRSRDRERHKDRERDKNRDKDRDRDRGRHRSKRHKAGSRDRSRSRERHKDKRRSRSPRSRSRSRGRKSKDRDGTIALLDQMVGTTTKATSRAVTNNGVNPATQAAILAAAAVAQTFVASRRMAAPVQPAAAAAAALSAATAIPPPTSVQQKLEQLHKRYGARHPRHHPHHEPGEAAPPAAGDELHGDASPPGETAEQRRLRRRRTRWMGSEHDKTFIPGLPTVLPSTLTKDQEDQYLLQLQIEEVSRKLRSGDLGIPPNVDERSPSPEPIYSTDGKRLNTREYRTRRKLEEQRHALVTTMHAINPEFKPPPDYKPPVVRVHDKVMIPQEEHPDINFVGLLIGPRGNTLKAMEKETGAKIIIRGKGSVKEGKVGRKDGQPLPGEDEPLHAYITATNADAVKKAVDKIKEVIRQGVEVPEGQNDLRRMQLRELAQLNGTLREHDQQRCANCTATDHKTWLCPDRPNVTSSVVCSSCGGAGHIARDCRARRPGHAPGAAGAADRAKIDEEYLSLMAELGEALPAGAPPPRRLLPAPRSAAQHAPRALMPPPGVEAWAKMLSSRPNPLRPPKGKRRSSWVTMSSMCCCVRRHAGRAAAAAGRLPPAPAARARARARALARFRGGRAAAPPRQRGAAASPRVPAAAASDASERQDVSPGYGRSPRHAAEHGASSEHGPPTEHGSPSQHAPPRTHAAAPSRHDGHGLARRVQPPAVGAPRAAAPRLPGAAAPPAARLRLLAARRRQGARDTRQLH